ncbi:GNAT family N-acetyltransferase [Echinicola salinicaeni]|uniref:GNAT family N-acetyltransferase n=1 Tax=Echinicola salinicaeni TaxID=2762757 RepID=UPI00164745B9|nr:GNAT family N-acetyltransferase [Echinicola salinicaeni]
MKNDFLISTDTELLDTDYIVDYLSNQSYWAKGRKPKRIIDAINHSFCFGVYLNNEQIGFARVITDFGVFAWISDLFIDPKFQGKGYGKALMKEISKHESLQSISRWGLNTYDAHGLYEQFGFEKVDNPDIYMEKLIKQE